MARVFWVEGVYVELVKAREHAPVVRMLHPLQPSEGARPRQSACSDAHRRMRETERGCVTQRVGSGFGVRDSGFEIRDSGFRIRGSRFAVRGSGFKIRDSGFRIRVGDDWQVGVGLLKRRK
eukprot:5636784-Pyramimonas_sp.AAC.1